MKLFKNTLKSITAVAAVVALSASMVAISASATPNGNLTFTHGQDASIQSTYGKIQSTEVETSMQVNGKATYYSGANKGNTIPRNQNVVYNTRVESNYIPHGSTKGASFFEYKVNGVKEHESTEWWNFDFT